MQFRHLKKIILDSNKEFGMSFVGMGYLGIRDLWTQ